MKYYIKNTSNFGDEQIKRKILHFKLFLSSKNEYFTFVKKMEGCVFSNRGEINGKILFYLSQGMIIFDDALTHFLFSKRNWLMESYCFATYKTVL